jgi:metal-responsive CopG/Arc/MetJ family transcriptional regulator
MQKYLATISVSLKNKDITGPETQRIFTEYGHLILARTGINLNRTDLSLPDTGIIMLIVEGTDKEIIDMTVELDNLEGVISKNVILSK